MADWLQTLSAFGGGFVDAQRQADVQKENQRRYDTNQAQDAADRTQRQGDANEAKALQKWNIFMGIWTNRDLPIEKRVQSILSYPGGGGDVFLQDRRNEPSATDLPGPND